MSQFNHLFSPVKIGSVEVKNRIVFPAHATVFKRGSEEDLAYFEARAKGGAGMIIVGGSLVGRVNQPQVAEILSYIPDPAEIPAAARLADTLHKHGTTAILQLFDVSGWFAESVSSSVPSVTAMTQNREQTTREVEELVQSYAEAAFNAKEAGFDGIQLHGSHGNGINQFLSPLFNKRTDKYGGNVEERCTFLLETLTAVRERVGNDFVVGLRFNADESMLGGTKLDEALQQVQILHDTGMIDFWDVDAALEPHQVHLMVGMSYFRPGFMLYPAAAVREVVDPIPVMGIGRINSPEYAEQILADGQCDLVGMARALIADPEFPNKAKQDETDDILPCIGCVEGCILRVLMMQPVGCAVNSETGQEAVPYQPAEVKKRVVVVGAGMTGMETAMVAAKRGHSVTLIEKRTAPGGFLSMRARLPGLTDGADAVRWMSQQLEKLNVDVRLGVEATPELVKSLSPDAVVIATGATYTREGLSGMNLRATVADPTADWVLTPEDILLEGKQVGEHVVVYDDTGYIVGPGLAELLADQGKQVEYASSFPSMVATMAPVNAGFVAGSRVVPKLHALHQDRVLLGVDNHTVTLMDPLTFTPTMVEDVDSVVLLTGRQPNDDLYTALVNEVPELHVVGGARSAMLGALGTYAGTQEGRAIGSIL